MVTEIVIIHLEDVRANGPADLRDDGLSLRIGMDAIAIIVPLVAMEPETAFPRAPRLHAQFFLLVAPIADDIFVGVLACELAAGGLPAVFGFALGARDAFLLGHGGRGGPAAVVEGVEGAELVGVVLEVHVGGELGLGVGVEVGGGAQARGLADGVEVRGPPDRVPDSEVLVPVAVVDGARVGGVPGLVKLVHIGDVAAWGGWHVGEDAGILGGGVVEDFHGDTVDDGDGAGGGAWDFVVGDDGQDWGGGWDRMEGAFDVIGRLGGGRDRIDGAFDVTGRLGGRQICRSHSDQSRRCWRVHRRGLQRLTVAESLGGSRNGGNVDRGRECCTVADRLGGSRKCGNVDRGSECW